MPRIDWTRHIRRLALGVVAAAACASPTGVTGPDTQLVDEYRVNGIVFTATARRVVGNSVEVTLTATNDSATPNQAGILGGGCMLRPRVYSKRGGKLLWSHFDRTFFCEEPLQVFDLAPGASESVSGSFSVYLESGDNFVTVTIEVGGQQVELAAGTVTV